MREAQRRPKTSKKYDVGMNATMYAIGPQFSMTGQGAHRKCARGGVHVSGSACQEDI